MCNKGEKKNIAKLKLIDSQLLWRQNLFFFFLWLPLHSFFARTHVRALISRKRQNGIIGPEYSYHSPNIMAFIPIYMILKVLISLFIRNLELENLRNKQRASNSN